MSCSYYKSPRLIVLKTAAIGLTECLSGISDEFQAISLLPTLEPELELKTLESTHHGPPLMKRGKGKRRREWDR